MVGLCFRATTALAERLARVFKTNSRTLGSYSMGQSSRLDHKPFMVPPGQKVRLKDYPTAATGEFRDKADAEVALQEDVAALAKAQDLLWASKEYSLIIILQALDAAGKDGTVKHVMSGVNPQGVDVHSFKAPTDLERLHHFLWRPMQALPPRGRIAIFNRSYYEEVLVVRVHPQFLEGQWLKPSLRGKKLKHVWEDRYDEINAFEKSLSNQHIRFLKFFLHISKEEQRERFLKRLNDPEKTWKFSAADVRERAFWNDYQEAYEDMLQATSTEQAPWYVIPADKKWFARACVADIIASRIAELDLKYPTLSDAQLVEIARAREELERENDG
jgi:PPK2 family polyphosphate:nucleotide phosphotransferase